MSWKMLLSKCSTFTKLCCRHQSNDRINLWSVQGCLYWKNIYEIFFSNKFIAFRPETAISPSLPCQIPLKLRKLSFFYSSSGCDSSVNVMRAASRALRSAGLGLGLSASKKLLYGNEIDWSDASTNQKRLIYVQGDCWERGSRLATA